MFIYPRLTVLNIRINRKMSRCCSHLRSPLSAGPLVFILSWNDVKMNLEAGLRDVTKRGNSKSIPPRGRGIASKAAGWSSGVETGKRLLVDHVQPGRSPGGGNGSPLQHSCQDRGPNLMDRGAWWATAHGVAESDRTDRAHTYSDLRTLFQHQLADPLCACHPGQLLSSALGLPTHWSRALLRLLEECFCDNHTLPSDRN